MREPRTLPRSATRSRNRIRADCCRHRRRNHCGGQYHRHQAEHQVHLDLYSAKIAFADVTPIVRRSWFWSSSGRRPVPKGPPRRPIRGSFLFAPAYFLLKIKLAATQEALASYRMPSARSVATVRGDPPSSRRLEIDQDKLSKTTLIAIRTIARASTTTLLYLIAI